MNDDKFTGIYEVDDGYAGGSRPQKFEIHESDLYDCETEEELSQLFEEIMQEDFEQSIYPYEKNKKEFIKWAKERMNQ